jgi:L-lactate dehydrogenase
VIRAEKRFFLVSVQAAAEYGIGPVVLSLPCVVGSAGIARQLHLQMSDSEQRLLQQSAAVLDAAHRSLDVAGTAPGTAAGA